MIEDIWNTFHHQLLAFISRKVSDKHQAEDILQDVFIKVIGNIHLLNDKQKLQSWLYQICRHSIIDYYRISKHALHSSEQDILDALVADTENHELQIHINQCLLTLINELPESVRALLLDSEFEHIKQKQLAQKYKLTLAATKSRILRGRKLLKKKLTACCHFKFTEHGPEATCHNTCDCS